MWCIYILLLLHDYRDSKHSTKVNRGTSLWHKFLRYNSSLKIKFNTGFNSCPLGGLASSHFSYKHQTWISNTYKYILANYVLQLDMSSFKCSCVHSRTLMFPPYWMIFNSPSALLEKKRNGSKNIRRISPAEKKNQKQTKEAKQQQRQRKRHLKINIWEMATILLLLLFPGIPHFWPSEHAVIGLVEAPLKSI